MCIEQLLILELEVELRIRFGNTSCASEIGKTTSIPWRAGMMDTDAFAWEFLPRFGDEAPCCAGSKGEKIAFIKETAKNRPCVQISG